MSGRAAEVAAVSAFAAALTLAVAAPVLRAPSERVFGMEIVGRHHDPFTVMEQFGRPIALGVYSQPLTDVPGAMIARLTGPVAAYNWLVLLTFPLAAATAYLLARYLTLPPLVAAIASIAFAFSPFHLAHAAYHPQIAQTQWIPLYFLALWRCLDDARAATVGILAAAMGAVTLSNFYGGLIVGVLTPVAIAAHWFFLSRREPRAVRHLAMASASLTIVAGGAIGYIWYTAPAVLVDRAAFAFPRSDLFRYSAKWWSYLVLPAAHPLLGRPIVRMWHDAGVHEGLLEQQVSLGWGFTALAGIAMTAWLGRGRQPRILRMVPVLATVAIVALVCSLSPERVIGPITFVRPSAFLYRIVPMFRAYARFGVVVQLMTALLAGIGAERLWSSGTNRPRIVCVALLALAAGEYAVWPPMLWRDVLPTAAHRWVAQQPGRVHALDCAPLTAESASIEWLTHARISMERGSLDDCTEPNFPEKLAAASYTHLLVRPDTPEGRWFAASAPPDGLAIGARFADGEVFAVTASAPLVYTVRMTAFSTREFDGSRSWRWMGNEASWTVANTSNRLLRASLDMQLTAFQGARGMTLLFDGRVVQTLIVEEQRAVHRIGPLPLTPGEHTLTFRPVDPPTRADDVLHNGDGRALSFAVGVWRWTVA